MFIAAAGLRTDAEVEVDVEAVCVVVLVGVVVVVVVPGLDVDVVDAPVCVVGVPAVNGCCTEDCTLTPRKMLLT